jgi:hypothetical protein
MHYNTFRLGREPMEEPLPRLMMAAERAGVVSKVRALAEGEQMVITGVDFEKKAVADMELASVG